MLSEGRGGDEQDRGSAFQDALRFALEIVDRHAAIIDGLAENAARKGHSHLKTDFERYAAEIRQQADIIRIEMPGLSDEPRTID